MALPCHIRKGAIRTWLDEQRGRHKALRNRWLAGVEDLEAVKSHYCGQPVPDPTECCRRATEALADASTWLEALDTQADLLAADCQRLIDAIDCSSPDPNAILTAFAAADAAVQGLSDWLDRRDDDLGTLEAFWRSLADGCPVVRDVAPLDPPDEPQ